MKKLFLLAIGLLAALPAPAQTPAGHWAIEVHAGAGNIAHASMDAQAEARYRAKLDEAIHAGAAVLDKGGSPLDAVETTIRILEDSAIFNTGRGAVFNSDGHVELDAAIMDGATLKAGAVSAVMRVPSPIALARTVMERSPYVMLTAEGAEKFAQENGIALVPNSIFYTERQWETLERTLRQQGKPIPQRPAELPAPAKPMAMLGLLDATWHGTVGVVARDRAGNLAAGTSTGGLSGKHPGRVGDTPVIGAGTYAANGICAVSGTGVGEYFIRLGVAREIANLMRFEHKTAQQAADTVIHQELEAMKGDGGVIVMPAAGDPVWSYNTRGMFRARLVEGGTPLVALYNDEP